LGLRGKLGREVLVGERAHLYSPRRGNNLRRKKEREKHRGGNPNGGSFLRFQQPGTGGKGEGKELMSGSGPEEGSGMPYWSSRRAPD